MDSRLDGFMSVSEILQFGRRQWVRILTGLGITVALVMVVTFLLTPVYESESLLLVKLGREYVYTPEVGDRAASASVNAARETAQLINELQIIQSQDLIQDVLTTVGVNVLYPKISKEARPTHPDELAAAVTRFTADISADRIRDADVLRVAYRHPNPDLAAKALKLLVERYLAKHLQAYGDTRATAFLEEKVADIRGQLQKAEDRLNQFQQETKAFSADDQRAQLLLQRRDVESLLKAARNEIAGLEQKIAYLRSEKEKVAASSRLASEQNKAVTDARAQLLELRLQEQKLLSSFSESSRAVESIRKQIGLVEQFLEEQRAVIGQGEYAEDLDKQIVGFEGDLHFQEARRDSLLGQISQIDKQLGALTDQGVQYRSLQRERDATDKAYQAYEQKLQEFKTFQEMDAQQIANISVIEPASPPLTPAYPRKLLNLVLGTFLGLGVGLAWAFATEYRAGRGRPEPAVVPAEVPTTLVEPGTVHWRTPGQGSAREAEPKPEDA
jgi:uncharacterized protein involved in exopolysaccharide biosynthesis